MAEHHDTIAAIATASGRGGIGVVRVSGPAVPQMMAEVIGHPIPAREAVLARFRARTGEAIDHGIALFFPAPASYTGEHVLELQGHGGQVVLRLLLRRCLEIGARLAAPGEFTERAFLNGKLDLAQAESVADLIDATTSEAAKCAMRSLEGVFSDRIHGLVDKLVSLRTLLEATLDFPDEEVEQVSPSRLREGLHELERALEVVLAASRQGSLLREGLHIVLLGEPNVGKSSLLNRLAGEDVVLVTEFPGTTRDAVRQAIDLSGVPVHVIDTAGLRVSDDPVEKLGIKRAFEVSQKADLALIVMDAASPDEGALETIKRRLPRGLPAVEVMNKIDLMGIAPHVDEPLGGPRVWISAKEGSGIDLLRDVVLAAIGWRADAEGVFLARERHIAALEEARGEIVGAHGHVAALEVLAEHLRRAQIALGRIVGEFTSDDLLGEIFTRFCIGK